MSPSPSAFQILRDEHAAIAAVLRALSRLVDRGPGDEPEAFFDRVRAMLFYIDEFPERRHHPKESDLLFPQIARHLPELMPVIRRLEAEHLQGETRVRELQHLLLAWELLGEPRRQAFVEQAQAWIRHYLDHMRAEEVQLLPAAERDLPPAARAELDTAFRHRREDDGSDAALPDFDRLFARILLKSPA